MNESQDWMDILNSNPGSKRGQHNPDRKALLAEGVSIRLSPQTAESWVPELRDIKKATAHRTDQVLANEGPEAVVMTILEIPEETRENAVSGKILVEVGGTEAWIDCSVFYNSIYEPYEPVSFSTIDGSPTNLIGGGGAIPTRGETSHANFNQRAE